jgi:hypothetical protein
MSKGVAMKDWEAPVTLSIRRGDAAAVVQAIGHATNVSEEAQRGARVIQTALDSPSKVEGPDAH